MKPINIIFDLNYLAFSEFSLFSKYGKLQNPLKREVDQASFIQGLSNRLFNIINQLPKGGKIVCCIDSKSWRKSFMGKYKERREDENGNKGIMDNETKLIFYNIIAEFGEILTDNGIIASKVSGAEGDDLIFKWSSYFKDRGENCIILTGDFDLTQIVCGPEEPWLVVWSNKSTNNKLFTNSGWLDYIENSNNSNTIFEFNLINDDNKLSKTLKDSGAEIKIMDVDYFILHKILIGDDGDDVPSSWKVKVLNSKGEDKWVRVTDKKANTIIKNITTNNINIKEWLNIILYKVKGTEEGEHDIDSKLDELSGNILRVMNDLDDSEIRKNVTLNIIRNARLVWLKNEMLPETINESIDESIKKSIDTLVSMNKAKTTILSGTRFGKFKIVPKTFDPFALTDLSSLDDLD